MAGIDTGYRERYLKTVRLVLLGEVDTSGINARIRRMSIDGQDVPITYENVIAGLDYAGNLVHQIFIGKGYNPALPRPISSAAPLPPKTHDKLQR